MPTTYPTSSTPTTSSQEPDGYVIMTAKALRELLSSLSFTVEVEWGEEDSAGFLNPTITKTGERICARCGGL